MYRFYVIRRCVLTVLCRLSAACAEKSKWSWVISIMDFLLLKHGEILGKEAVFCMAQTRRWQEKAKKCVLAHHQFEKFMKPEEKKCESTSQEK